MRFSVHTALSPSTFCRQYGTYVFNEKVISDKARLPYFPSPSHSVLSLSRCLSSFIARTYARHRARAEVLATSS